MTTTYQIIQVRRGTAAAWVTYDPTMVAGEIGHETDTGMMKIGDGTTAWISLPYITVYAYKRTMIANETIPYLSRVMLCSIDPNGAARNLNPVGTFPAGSVIMITNRGAYNINFDSTGVNVAIGSGQKEFFIYDGTTWG
ncbi:MAG: hypothetical protein KKD77_24545 [Gammaproteobacteria bacterium]|nr:hypothetical protein [Gammaproteobacteria bacterium]